MSVIIECVDCHTTRELPDDGSGRVRLAPADGWTGAPPRCPECSEEAGVAPRVLATPLMDQEPPENPYRAAQEGRMLYLRGVIERLDNEKTDAMLELIELDHKLRGCCP